MKNKKLISSLLSVGLMVGITTPAFAYTDVPDTNPYVAYANENYLLPELDKNGKFEPLKKVTFQEFADIVTMYYDNVIIYKPALINLDGLEDLNYEPSTGKFYNFSKKSIAEKRYTSVLRFSIGPDYDGTRLPKAKAQYPANKVMTWNDLLNFIEFWDVNNAYGNYQRGTSNPSINQLTGAQPLPKSTKTYANFHKLSKWQQKLVTKHNDFLQIVLPHKELNLKKPMTRIELVKALKVLGPGLHGDRLVNSLKRKDGDIVKLKREEGYTLTQEETNHLDWLKKQPSRETTMEEAQRLYH